VTGAEITADLASGASLAALQEKRGCGTFCGSCLPELRQVVAAHASETHGATTA